MAHGWDDDVVTTTKTVATGKDQRKVGAFGSAAAAAAEAWKRKKRGKKTAEKAMSR